MGRCCYTTFKLLRQLLASVITNDIPEADAGIAHPTPTVFLGAKRRWSLCHLGVSENSGPNIIRL